MQSFFATQPKLVQLQIKHNLENACDISFEAICLS